jgi:Protein of unknown function (DUF3489)
MTTHATKNTKPKASKKKATFKNTFAKQRSVAAKPAQAPETTTNGEAAPTARDGSKTAAVLALLRRPDGATLEEIMTATSWQAHTVRGFISGTLGKKLGLAVASVRGEDNVRTYRVGL